MGIYIAQVSLQERWYTVGTWEHYLISFLSHARLKKESTRC